MNIEQPTRILPYAQKVFEQMCRGKAAYSLFEYLNSFTLREELRKTVDLYDDRGEFSECMRSFDKKWLNILEKKKNNAALTKEDIITEEDLIRLIDNAVLNLLAGEGEGFTSVGCAIDALMNVGLIEEYRFAGRYLSEIRKYVTDEWTNHLLDFCSRET